jgi:hypothetical protein
MTTKLFTAVMGTALLALAGCQSTQDKTPADTLVATFTSAAPNMAAGASDPVWASAKPLSAALTGGVNFGAKPGDKGESTVTLKAAYTADMLYMLIQYKDPTNSVRRGPYQKQADGSWKKLKDPADKGGDDNVYYEDKWAMLWPTNEATGQAVRQGRCAMACHEGQTKPYGNKYTNTPGQILDMWHMKGQRTGPLGFVDDQYTDDTRYDPKTAPTPAARATPARRAASTPISRSSTASRRSWAVTPKPPMPAAPTTSRRARKSPSTTASSSPATRWPRSSSTR